MSGRFLDSGQQAPIECCGLAFESIHAIFENIPLYLALYLVLWCCGSCSTDGCGRPISLWSLETVEKQGHRTRS